MKKPFTLLLVVFSCCSISSRAQTIGDFFRKMYLNKDSSKRSSFVIVPVLSTSPETGLEAGATGLYSFYSDTLSKATKVSNVFAYATVTTKNQTNLTLTSNYWFPDNKYHLVGGISYINFPFNFYGIGNDTRQEDQTRLGQHRFKLNMEAEAKTGDFLLGLVSGAFDYQFTNPNPDDIFNTDPQIQGKEGGASVYLGPSVIFDTRNNNTYTTRGTIVTAYLNAMQGLFSNNNYQGAFLNVEYSSFFSLSKQLVLGFDIQEQSLMGGLSPFYLLPSLGSDEMMRGYYNGRFRDRNFIAGQTELRYRFNPRLGIVAFAATGEVFHDGFSTHNLKPDWGGGVRYFFDVQKGLSIRFDYGVGEQRPGETRQSGFYIGLGEAF